MNGSTIIFHGFPNCILLQFHNECVAEQLSAECTGKMLSLFRINMKLLPIINYLVVNRNSNVGVFTIKKKEWFVMFTLVTTGAVRWQLNDLSLQYHLSQSYEQMRQIWTYCTLHRFHRLIQFYKKKLREKFTNVSQNGLLYFSSCIRNVATGITWNTVKPA